MKIAVISDTHIPSYTKTIPNDLLEVFKRMDMILHAGDLVELEVLELLNSVCPNVKAVYGNMDSAPVKKKLHKKEIIYVNKYKIGLTHGSGSPASILKIVTETFKDEKVDLIVFGHSHNPLIEKKGSILYFNPGSLGDMIFASYNSYGIIEINDSIIPKIIRIN